MSSRPPLAPSVKWACCLGLALPKVPCSTVVSAGGGGQGGESPEAQQTWEMLPKQFLLKGFVTGLLTILKT